MGTLLFFLTRGAVFVLVANVAIGYTVGEVALVHARTLMVVTVLEVLT